MLDVTLITMKTIAKFIGTADIPMQHAQSFLLVANSRSPISMGEVMEQVGVAQSSLSRHMEILGQGRPSKPGLQLLQAYEDPEYRRRKLVQLTPRGKLLVEEIKKATERLVH